MKGTDIIRRAAEAIDDAGTEAIEYKDQELNEALAVILRTCSASFDEASEILLVHDWDMECDCLSHQEYRAFLVLAKKILGEDE